MSAAVVNASWQPWTGVRQLVAGITPVPASELMESETVAAVRSRPPTARKPPESSTPPAAAAGRLAGSGGAALGEPQRLETLRALVDSWALEDTHEDIAGAKVPAAVRIVVGARRSRRR